MFFIHREKGKFDRIFVHKTEEVAKLFKGEHRLSLY